MPLSKQDINAGFSLFNTAVSAFSTYSSASHAARMNDINWKHNRDMVRENFKVNRYISARNEIEILRGSSKAQLQISVSSMEAKANARVTQAAYGIQGGSAQQVLHSISRSAATAESSRLASLDDALFGNRMQLFQTGSSAIAATGLKPVDSFSPALTALNAVQEGAENLKNIYG